MTTTRPEDTPPLGEIAECQRLIERLPRHSEVRDAAERLLAGQQPRSIAPLFTALADNSSRRWRERCVAAWALGRAKLTPQEREAAVEMMRRLLARKSGSVGSSLFRALTAALLAAGSFILALMLLFMIGSHGFIGGPEPAGWLILILTAFSISAPIYLIKDVAAGDNHARAAAATSLGRLEATEATGELAAVLFEAVPPVRQAAANALHALLPALSPDQFGQFTPDAILALGRSMDHPDRLLALKALEAMEKIGTPAAIPLVERVAAQSRTPGVREAAARVLAVLRERETRLREARTLVRPAAAPPDDTLLRPASSTETAQELLLRPSEKQQGK